MIIRMRYILHICVNLSILPTPVLKKTIFYWIIARTFHLLLVFSYIKENIKKRELWMRNLKK